MWHDAESENCAEHRGDIHIPRAKRVPKGALCGVQIAVCAGDRLALRAVDADGGLRKVINMNNTVKEFIAQVLKVEVGKVVDDLAVGDIPEWDSLHHMMIITGLQKEFGVEFQREELIDIENVADLVALVEEKTKT